MYSYYGLSDEIKEILETVEQDLKRPIWVSPSRPSGGLGTRGSRMRSRFAEALELPHLTVAQLEEMTIFVSFSWEGVRCERETIELRDYGPVEIEIVNPEDDHPFVVTARVAEGEDEDVVVAVVEPGHVRCAISDLPYFSQGVHAVTAAEVWRAIAEGVRLAASDEVVEEFATRRRAVVRQRVAELVARNNGRAIARRREEIDECETSVRAHERRLREAITAARRHQTELDLLVRMSEQDTGEALLAEFDAMAAHPRITSVDLDEGSTALVLKTDTIVMTHPGSGETRRLGRFKIKLLLDSNTVSLTNLDNPRNGRDHPHVIGHEPCFGGHERQFTEVLTAGRWSVLLELLFQYLETVNLYDDWGRYASYWFDVPDWDPDATTEDGRPVLATASDGRPIHDGDRVRWINVDDGQTVTGVASGNDDALGWSVQRDDGVRGGAPRGGWYMRGEQNVELVGRPVLAVDLNGEAIHEGDTVTFVDETGDSGEGPAYAHDGRLYVARDDLREGGAPDGGWWLEDVSDLYLADRATADLA